MEEAKDFPNVLLILSPDHFGLIKAFNRYANVFVHFIDPGSFAHVMHRFPGRLKAECKRIPDPLLKFTAKFLNPPHRVGIRQLDPEMIDLVFVSDPVTCRIDLKPFKNAVKAYWAQDCTYPSTFYTQILSTHIQEYDIVFCALKSCLSSFRKLGLKVSWLTFAYDPDVYKPTNISKNKIYDVTFIGTLNQRRRQILRELREFSPHLHMFIGNAWQHEAAYIYSHSYVALNIFRDSRVRHINWRVFEVLGCCCLLITEEGQEIEEFFQNKRHLIIYKNTYDLIEAIEYFLKNHEERDTIALQGFRTVKNQHTIYHRVEQVLKQLGLHG